MSLFLVMGKNIYPDYEKMNMQYIRMFKPVVLHSRPIYLDKYIPILSWQYMGENYTISAPSE